MLAIKDKTTFPCKQCLHRGVCALIGKMEETKVVLQDNHFSALIECSEFIPVLDDNSKDPVAWNDVKESEEEEQAE